MDINDRFLAFETIQEVPAKLLEQDQYRVHDFDLYFNKVFNPDVQYPQNDQQSAQLMPYEPTLYEQCFVQWLKRILKYRTLFLKKSKYAQYDKKNTTLDDDGGGDDLYTRIDYEPVMHKYSKYIDVICQIDNKYHRFHVDHSRLIFENRLKTYDMHAMQVSKVLSMKSQNQTMESEFDIFDWFESTEHTHSTQVSKPIKQNTQHTLRTDKQYLFLNVHGFGIDDRGPYGPESQADYIVYYMGKTKLTNSINYLEYLTKLIDHQDWDLMENEWMLIDKHAFHARIQQHISHINFNNLSLFNSITQSMHVDIDTKNTDVDQLKHELETSIDDQLNIQCKNHCIALNDMKNQLTSHDLSQTQDYTTSSDIASVKNLNTSQIKNLKTIMSIWHHVFVERYEASNVYCPTLKNWHRYLSTQTQEDFYNLFSESPQWYFLITTMSSKHDRYLVVDALEHSIVKLYRKSVISLIINN